MPNNKKSIGNLGERLAGEYLVRQGYEIIGRNYHARGGEIDIIARDKRQFVFVEVKARTDDAFGSPAEAVTYHKQRKMMLAIKDYVFKNNEDLENCRIDVVSVMLDGEENRARIRHFKSITNN